MWSRRNYGGSRGEIEYLFPANSHEGSANAQSIDHEITLADDPECQPIVSEAISRCIDCPAVSVLSFVNLFIDQPGLQSLTCHSPRIIPLNAQRISD
jgi:hypothetical protein